MDKLPTIWTDEERISVAFKIADIAYPTYSLTRKHQALEIIRFVLSKTPGFLNRNSEKIAQALTEET